MFGHTDYFNGNLSPRNIETFLNLRVLGQDVKFGETYRTVRVFYYHHPEGDAYLKEAIADDFAKPKYGPDRGGISISKIDTRRLRVFKNPKEDSIMLIDKASYYEFDIEKSEENFNLLKELAYQEFVSLSWDEFLELRIAYVNKIDRYSGETLSMLCQLDENGEGIVLNEIILKHVLQENLVKQLIPVYREPEPEFESEDSGLEDSELEDFGYEYLQFEYPRPKDSEFEGCGPK